MLNAPAQVVALSASMDSATSDDSSVRVVPRHLDLLEMLVAGLASFMYEVRVEASPYEEGHRIIEHSIIEDIV